jgi:uncharacterized protein YifE (UPF0438 family)
VKDYRNVYKFFTYRSRILSRQTFPSIHAVFGDFSVKKIDYLSKFGGLYDILIPEG